MLRFGARCRKSFGRLRNGPPVATRSESAGFLTTGRAINAGREPLDMRVRRSAIGFAVWSCALSEIKRLGSFPFCDLAGAFVFYCIGQRDYHVVCHVRMCTGSSADGGGIGNLRFRFTCGICTVLFDHFMPPFGRGRRSRNRCGQGFAVCVRNFLVIKDFVIDRTLPYWSL